MIERNSVRVCGLEFVVSARTADGLAVELELVVEPVSNLPDTFLLRYRPLRTASVGLAPAEVSIEWSVPVVDMHGLYVPPPSPGELASLPYWRFEKRSAAYLGVPFFSLFHRDGENRHAFGLLDQVAEASLEATLSEATRAYTFRWHKRITGEESTFVSAARRPWPEILRVYVETVDREKPEPKLPVPDSAYEAVFCTWTAIHHEVSQEWVLRNATLAAELGFGTWLTDDGWFTDRATFGDYRFTGDWQPSVEKFPDFAGHVRAVQSLGLRYVLWAAPFMVGDASRAAGRYAELLTEPTNALGYRNLAPGGLEVSGIVGDVVERLVRDFALDGLKLDFIDSIEPDAGVGEGLYATLSRAVDRARSIRPDLLVEVRNNYANLASRRYANVYRASDVPLNFAANRWQVTMLRLLAPDRAVHLDPALWHPDDTDENVAVHLINAIASVPMVSIELDRYPQSHLALIRTWIGFYREHRQAIVHGEFAPEIRLGSVPLIRFNGTTERIIGLYDDVAFLAGDDQRALWILNASTRAFVDLLPDGSSASRRVVTRDKFGRVVGDEDVAFPTARLPVEVGGSLELRPA